MFEERLKPEETGAEHRKNLDFDLKSSGGKEKRRTSVLGSGRPIEKIEKKS